MTEWLPPFEMMGMLRLGANRPRIPSWIPDANPANGGLVLNLGAGEKHISTALSLDLPEWDADADPIPYPDESVTSIYALHFLEHVRDPIALLRECQRVLVSGGHLNVVVPHWNTQLAHSDLDHKTSWDEETWSRIFNNKYYAKGHDGWRFRIGTNVLMGIDARNLLIITQLIKELREGRGMELSKVRARLLELFMEELRTRERLTGGDRITLYRQFHRILELDQLTKQEEADHDSSTGADLPDLRGIPAARVRSYSHPEAAAIYGPSPYRHH